MNTIEGKLDASGLKVAIVVSRFNEFITGKLLDGAVDCLKRNNASDKDISADTYGHFFQRYILTTGLERLSCHVHQS